MTLLHVAIVLPFLAAALVPVVYKWLRTIHTGWFVLAVPAALFIYFMNQWGMVRDGSPVYASVPWIPSLGINFSVYLDGLSLLFALLITGIGALVVLYSIYYLGKGKEDLGSFYLYLLLFMGAMLGVTIVDNLIVLYMFWEFTSLSSFLLIAFWYHRERSMYGAMKSMLITVLGGLAMLGGFILLYLMTDTFSIREIIDQAGSFIDHSFFLPSMLLILVGAFTKSAQFPFHIWLPDAMEAPTPVSAYLHSATMVKAGIYLVARMSPIFAGQAEWFWIVSTFGMITLFWGSFTAIRQTDLKALLAYSTISQLGLIMCLLGIGSAAAAYPDYATSILFTNAIAAAIFHLVNHATFKGALFMMAGIVDHETGVRDIRKLGGLMAFMPITFSIALIGAFSMAGLPPFNGFLSKEMFFTGVLQLVRADVFHADAWGTVFPVLAWVASVFTFIYSMILVFRTFTGKAKLDQLEKKPHEAPIGMLISPLILVSLVIVFGLFPNIAAYGLVEPAVASIQPLEGDTYHAHIRFWHGWTPELFMTIGVVALGVVLFLSMSKWLPTLKRLFRGRYSLNRAYDRMLVMLEGGSRRINSLHMTGSVRDYLIYIFSFFILLLGTALFTTGSIRADFSKLSEVAVHEVLLAIVMVVAAVVMLFTSSRLTAIISVGVVGYLVSLFFVLFRAPDLALTQLIIETVSVALFLLCFYHLPQLRKEMNRIRFRAINAVVSIAVGAIVTLIALSAQGVPWFDPISDYFKEASYKEAGGKNMVNVILVDFRGFDTMLEILVLGIASLGVYAMIKLRLVGRDEQ
jgi:multicomponent Na+:H+ antiporter subunit A